MRSVQMTTTLIGFLTSLSLSASPLTILDLQEKAIFYKNSPRCFYSSSLTAAEVNEERQYSLHLKLVTQEGFHFMAAYRYIPVIDRHGKFAALCYVSDDKKDFDYHVKKAILHIIG